MNRRKIPLSAKRRQRAARVKILAEVGIYQRRLERLRAAQIRKSLSAVIDYPYQEWSARLEWDEPYIGKILNNIYKLSSVNGSEKQLEEWGVKSSPVWQNTFDKWVKANIGKEIVIVTGTMKKWLIDNVMLFVEEYGDMGVEYMTKKLYSSISLAWSGVKEWECRRIIQTEALTSFAVSGMAAIDSLNTPYEKCWSTSGLTNTRMEHLEMEGVCVDENDPFIVGGEMMMYPHDSSMGASAGNIINCACDVLCVPKN